MSDLLGQMRQETADKLAAAGVTAVPNWPARAVPYSAVVVAGLPYITTGSPGQVPFGQAIVNHRVVLIAGSGTADVQAAKLGDLLLKCLSALRMDWDEVSDFYVTNASPLGDVVACDISISQVIQIPQEVP